MDKEYPVEKDNLLKKDADKLGLHLQKNTVKQFSLILHRNQLKLDRKTLI